MKRLFIIGLLVASINLVLGASTPPDPPLCDPFDQGIYTMVPTVAWDCDASLVRGINGSRLYANGVLIADLPCWIVVYDFPDYSLEFYMCTGIGGIDAALQRYYSQETPGPVEFGVTVYVTGYESEPALLTFNCWPEPMVVLP